MHRLFVALRPPPPMRERLLAAMGGIAGARWQDDARLHLTLRFIGQVDRRHADDIAAALTAIRGPRPCIAIEGVGAFETKRRVTSLWAAVPPDAALDRLRRSIDRALVHTGLPPDDRAFRPHITLARLPRLSASVDPWVAEAAGLRAPATVLGGFRLYESHLGAGGAVYRVVADYALD